MGKSDFKKMNGWDEIIDERAALNKFYDTAAQDQPSNGKKKTKVKPKKSNHKHIYEQVLVHYEDFSTICRADRCTICGKINNVDTGTCVNVENGHYRALTNEEILEKYKDLPLIEGGKFF